MPSSDRIKGLADRIKARREQLKLSQPDLAMAMGGKASRTEVSQYENGWKQPSAAKLIDLSRALRCSVDYLLGLSSKP